MHDVFKKWEYINLSEDILVSFSFNPNHNFKIGNLSKWLKKLINQSKEIKFEKSNESFEMLLDKDFVLTFKSEKEFDSTNKEKLYIDMMDYFIKQKIKVIQEKVHKKIFSNTRNPL